jgi:hypothetical protein
MITPVRSFVLAATLLATTPLFAGTMGTNPHPKTPPTTPTVVVLSVVLSLFGF